MRLARLDDVSLVTQSAMNALNPVMRIENQIIDGLEDHGYEKSKAEFRKQVRPSAGTCGAGSQCGAHVSP